MKASMTIAALAMTTVTPAVVASTAIDAQSYRLDIVGTAGSSTILEIDVSGFTFNDVLGSSLNESISIAIGQGAEVSGMGWSLFVTTIGSSLLSENSVNFEGQLPTPTNSDAFGATNLNIATSPLLFPLGDFGLPNITVGSDGILDIEFYESVVQNNGTGDSFYESGSVIYLQVENYVPAPASTGLVALGGLAMTRRRRS